MFSYGPECWFNQLHDNYRNLIPFQIKSMIEWQVTS